MIILSQNILIERKPGRQIYILQEYEQSIQDEELMALLSPAKTSILIAKGERENSIDPVADTDSPLGTLLD